MEAVKSSGLAAPRRSLNDKSAKAAVTSVRRLNGADLVGLPGPAGRGKPPLLAKSAESRREILARWRWEVAKTPFLSAIFRLGLFHYASPQPKFGKNV
ncbi:hypothetical protein [Poseidonocella sp. HB161398]|uniref:hypothetical protein n=1 Tax=Poseidonocella sp. HB161398 TaxID=2320855 RepID=UPI001109C9F9|nr:hypothetical protein [Poseidonocella sp. HB161398]